MRHATGYRWRVFINIHFQWILAWCCSTTISKPSKSLMKIKLFWMRACKPGISPSNILTGGTVAGWTSHVLWKAGLGTSRRCSLDLLCRSTAATSGSTVSNYIIDPETYSQPQHRSLLNNSSNRFINAAPTNYHFNIQTPDSITNTLPNSYSAEQSCMQKLKTQWCYAAEKVDMLLHEVNGMEVKLNINQHWTVTLPEHISTIKYVQEWKYHISKLGPGYTPLHNGL